MRRSIHIGLSLLAALALSLVVPATPAHSAPDDSFKWSVQPSSRTGPTGRDRFDYQTSPGRRISDIVGVTNLGTEPLTVLVYATDAFTSGEGAFALLPASQPARDLGSWINLGRQAYTIPVGRRLDIPFEVTVPTNATPGDHAAGVIASVVEQQTTADGQRVNVDRRIAARVYLRVDGPISAKVSVDAVEATYHGTWNPFAFGTTEIRYRLRNDGNVRVGGKAGIALRGPLGVGLGGKENIEVPEMLPGAEVFLTERVEGVAPLGRLTASVTLNPVSAEGDLPASSRSGSTWAPPWSYLALLVLVIGALVGWRLRRRRLRSATVDG